MPDSKGVLLLVMSGEGNDSGNFGRSLCHVVDVAMAGQKLGLIANNRATNGLCSAMRAQFRHPWIAGYRIVRFREEFVRTERAQLQAARVGAEQARFHSKLDLSVTERLAQ